MSALSHPVTARRLKQTIPASTTVTFDSNTQGTVHGLRYFVTATGNSRSKAMDVTVVDDNGSIFDSVFAKIGGPISLNINAKVSGSDIILEVINNELFSVDVEALKFVTGT